MSSAMSESGIEIGTEIETDGSGDTEALLILPRRRDVIVFCEAAPVITPQLQEYLDAFNKYLGAFNFDAKDATDHDVSGFVHGREPT
jgi:hypothetical protein